MSKFNKNLLKSLIFVFFFIFLFIPSGIFAINLNIDYPAQFNITGQTKIPEYFKFIFDLAMFVGFSAVFLTLVVAGVLYLLSPAVPNARLIAKDRVSGAISGLLILATIYLVITTINPALSIFKTTEISPVPVKNPTVARQPGIYLYNKNNCPESEFNFFSAISSPDIGDSKQQINSAQIVQNEQFGIYYIGILFENLKFWGKCQYINPNKKCNKVEPFASSLAVYRYNHNPNEGGVTFYRKPFFDSAGGSYEVPGHATGNIYIKELKELTFNNVPKEEQECVRWDKKGVCTKTEPQNLFAENIASIKIEGDYLVLLIYFDNDKPDPENGPWSFCQAFGTFGDKDKEGPREIKWENIRNLNSGNLPN